MRFTSPNANWYTGLTYRPRWYRGKTAGFYNESRKLTDKELRKIMRLWGI
jgi:hypothetical protein